MEVKDIHCDVVLYIHTIVIDNKVGKRGAAVTRSDGGDLRTTSSFFSPTDTFTRPSHRPLEPPTASRTPDKSDQRCSRDHCSALTNHPQRQQQGLKMWRLNPTPSFPDYTGPYKVGSVDIEIPATDLHEAGEDLSSQPDVQTVAFRAFYPCTPPTAPSRPVRWVHGPQHSTISAYIRFIGAGTTLANFISCVSTGRVPRTRRQCADTKAGTCPRSSNTSQYQSTATLRYTLHHTMTPAGRSSSSRTAWEARATHTRTSAARWLLTELLSSRQTTATRASLHLTYERRKRERRRSCHTIDCRMWRAQRHTKVGTRCSSCACGDDIGTHRDLETRRGRQR
ncbi:hypothetical protein MRB53_037504 [Persea americana]|nr:hypothetical protein MRB53_037504 [Persea americana]